jgi:AbrB family looped-hinge helix DNA binding protein
MAYSKATTRVVRQLRSGQITIPSEFRKKLGIEKDSLLQLTLTRDEISLKLMPTADNVAGSPWFKELYEEFAAVRDEANAFTPEEINGAIDGAIRSVRQKR